MLNEKHGDSFSWRNKLDELDTLPGETFSNKNEAWEKLHQRLRSNSNRLKAAWYWIAAACLLFIILVPWNKRDPDFVKIKPGRNENKFPVMRPLPAQDMGTGSSPGISRLVITTTPVKNVTEKSKNANKPDINIDGKDTLSDYTIADQAETGGAVIDNPVRSIDSSVVKIAPPFVKKKLRVVHVNELGVPVEDETRDERYAERPSYYKMLTNQNQDMYSIPSTNSHAYSNDFLKIKISPQN